MREIVSGIEAENRASQGFDRKCLQVRRHGTLAVREPIPNSGFDPCLQARQVAGNRFGREGCEQAALALRMRLSVEQRNDVWIATKERQYISRHRTCALDFRFVKPSSYVRGSGDKH